MVGRVFQRSAVAAIAPPDQVPPPLETHLEDAILRDIITEERAPDEPTFRFRHILIRDVAYNTLPKARRAELHARSRTGCASGPAPRIDEFVEIEAYHLEQAVKLKREVGEPVEDSAVQSAADALLGSARKASMRQDRRATAGFAERGLAIGAATLATQLELKWFLAEALYWLGEYVRAAEVATGLAEAARAAGRKDLEGRAGFVKAGGIWISPESADAEAALAALARARDLLTEAEDWTYLALVLEYLGYDGWWYGDFDKARAVWTEMGLVQPRTARPTSRRRPRC